MSDSIKVFISYAHRDQNYEDAVLRLSNRLRSEGIDASIDQYEEAPAEGWPRWMEKQVATSDYVIILCDETYHRKLYSDTKGKGVVWEASLIYQLLYDASTETTKFIPAFLNDDDQQYIPTPLKSFTYYNLSDEEQYNKLYWRLRGVKNVVKPPLGELKPLPEKKRKTMFFSTPIDIQKWDSAKWRGVVYLWGKDAPAIGLFFDNYGAGKEIFYEWKRHMNGADIADEFLKVDYIVPPFPENCWVKRSRDRNFGNGYFLHIGSNIDATINRASNAGILRDELFITTVSRYQWMDEPNGSNNRDGFLEMYHDSGKYYLVPVGIKNLSLALSMDNMQFDFDCAIPMKNIAVTAGKDVDENDPCVAVLRKPEAF